MEKKGSRPTPDFAFDGACTLVEGVSAVVGGEQLYTGNRKSLDKPGFIRNAPLSNEPMQTERVSESERQRARDRERETESERQRARDRERETESERQRARDRERETESERQRARDRERETESERQRARDRERETEILLISKSSSHTRTGEFFNMKNANACMKKAPTCIRY
ncbi:PREDICTED: putative uncharacterized protein DDB_G0271982 [Ceratosolen solmsi marchali]|uniref:Uncharacterized protein n=1 Tax=Ceratosolen solmsi marchali TaxID=326594 RepID=A0AAJ6YNT1_9HYME|nr:PREDICTED: putative uncharacterized protein DDB_G0271982 [Ceratosolen solmsi marchali]